MYTLIVNRWVFWQLVMIRTFKTLVIRIVLVFACAKTIKIFYFFFLK